MAKNATHEVSPPSIREAGSDNADSDSLSMKMLALLWLLVWLLVFIFCVCLRPSFPDTSLPREERGNRRNGQGRNRQRRRNRKKKNEIDPVKRKKLLDEALITKKVFGCGRSGSSPSSAPYYSGDGKEQISVPTVEGSGPTNEDDAISCMICLEEYKNEEELSWSRKMACRHVFHKECIEQWLMKHDECPCCRTTFFNSDEGVGAERDDTQNTRDIESGGIESGSNEEVDSTRAFITMHGMVSSFRSTGRTSDGQVHVSAAGSHRSFGRMSLLSRLSLGAYNSVSFDEAGSDGSSTAAESADSRESSRIHHSQGDDYIGRMVDLDTAREASEFVDIELGRVAGGG